MSLSCSLSNQCIGLSISLHYFLRNIRSLPECVEKHQRNRIAKGKSRYFPAHIRPLCHSPTHIHLTHSLTARHKLWQVSHEDDENHMTRNNIQVAKRPKRPSERRQHGHVIQPHQLIPSHNRVHVLSPISKTSHYPNPRVCVLNQSMSARKPCDKAGGRSPREACVCRPRTCM